MITTTHGAYPLNFVATIIQEFIFRATGTPVKIKLQKLMTDRGSVWGLDDPHELELFEQAATVAIAAWRNSWKLKTN